MGKNRDRESLIRLMVNTIVHEIVFKYTNRLESRHFLSAEIIEYRGQAGKMIEQHYWDEDDKRDIRKKLLKKIKEKMGKKYSDVDFSIEEAEKLVDMEMKEAFE